MPAAEPVARAHVLISGRVQGVGFRYATHRQAGRLGLSGWVRNLPDGRVEAVFQGHPDVVAEAVAWCHRGPRGAQVDRVEVRHEPPADGPAAFRIRA